MSVPCKVRHVRHHAMQLSLSEAPLSLSLTRPRTRTQVGIVYYSMYGHIRTMALEVKKGLEAVDCKVTLLRVEETLSDEVLTKMGAPGIGKEDEVATAANIAEYDCQDAEQKSSSSSSLPRARVFWQDLCSASPRASAWHPRRSRL